MTFLFRFRRRRHRVPVRFPSPIRLCSTFSFLLDSADAWAHYVRPRPCRFAHLHLDLECFSMASVSVVSFFTLAERLVSWHVALLHHGCMHSQQLGI